MCTTVPIKNKRKLNTFRNYYKEVKYSPRNYALIVLGLNSALRIGDILSLRWSDVYRDSKNGYRSHLSVREAKTGKQNILAINASSREAPELYRQSLVHFDSEGFIFTSQKPPYTKISRSQEFRIIKGAAVYCGLGDDISCHSLRKTFGYHAWKKGTPPAMLMKIYNHSSYEVAKRYLGIGQTEKDEVFMKNFLLLPFLRNYSIIFNEGL